MPAVFLSFLQWNLCSKCAVAGKEFSSINGKKVVEEQDESRLIAADHAAKVTHISQITSAPEVGQILGDEWLKPHQLSFHRKWRPRIHNGCKCSAKWRVKNLETSENVSHSVVCVVRAPPFHSTCRIYIFTQHHDERLLWRAFVSLLLLRYLTDIVFCSAAVSFIVSDANQMCKSVCVLQFNVCTKISVLCIISSINESINQSIMRKHLNSRATSRLNRDEEKHKNKNVESSSKQVNRRQRFSFIE